MTFSLYISLSLCLMDIYKANYHFYKEMQETQVPSLGWEDPLEEEMAIHSSSCLGNPLDRGAWRATVHRVAKSWTQLSS